MIDADARAACMARHPASFTTTRLEVAMPNPAGKQRKPTDTPYMTWRSGDWTWDVLKSWQGANGKPGARWMCKVTSPYTHGGYDLGDTYVYDVVTNAELVSWDHDIWPTDEHVHEYVNTPTPPQPVAFF